MTVGGSNFNSFSQGVPVHVNPVIARPTGAESDHLGLDMRIGPDEVSVVKRHAYAQKGGVPVLVDPVLHDPTGAESESLDVNMRVGFDDVSVAKKHHRPEQVMAQLENPVVNPPYNNWSVNQPSVPHASGLAGKEDLGQHIIVDGHQVSY